MIDIIKGQVKKPYSVILYGTPGVGKTSFAAGWIDDEGVQHEGAENPIFVGNEENDEISCDRFPIPKTFDEVKAQLTQLLKTDHNYKTVVIDTLDSIEKLLHQKILAEDPKATGAMAKAFGGYGAAYEKADHEMVQLRSLLKSLRDDKKMNVLILAHSKKTTATDTILGMSYDTYGLGVHHKVESLFVDWVQAVLFATYLSDKKDDVNSDKTFALGHGERILLTQKRPGHLGKNRFALPYEMPLDFKEFKLRYHSFYDDNRVEKSDDVLPEIMGLLENADEALKTKVKSSVSKAKDDVTKLNNILKHLRVTLGA